VRSSAGFPIAWQPVVFALPAVTVKAKKRK
jgi:hypothetical protein